MLIPVWYLLERLTRGSERAHSEGAAQLLPGDRATPADNTGAVAVSYRWLGGASAAPPGCRGPQRRLRSGVEARECF